MEPVDPVWALSNARRMAEYNRQIGRPEGEADVLFEVRRNPGTAVDLGSRAANRREELRNRVLADLGIGRRFTTIG